jgi:2-keto-3-deoxy-L-rhamnonate aldolase RhmA
MGLTGQTTHPDVKEAIDLVINKCKETGLPWGIFGATTGSLKHYKKEGCRYLLCGIDSVVLMNSYKEIIKKLSMD